jgi:hypothetical protein
LPNKLLEHFFLVVVRTETVKTLKLGVNFQRN